MTVGEIKLRRLTNQYLLSPGEKLEVAQNLCGIQAQFFSNAIHSLKTRCLSFDEKTVGEDLVKNWTLRGTMHVFARADLPLFLDEKHYRSNQWEDANFWNQRKDWALTPERQQYLSAVILETLTEESRSREELKELCRAEGMTDAEEASLFHPWGGGVRQLCERGFLHYAAQEEKIFCLSPEVPPIPEEKRKLELAHRYFENFGPATIHDAMYFFKATAAEVKRWLSLLPVNSCHWQGSTYFYIENGKRYDRNISECLFLAGFDQLMLGYEKKESLFLRPEDIRSVFSLAGIVLPSVLLDGEVAGKWKMKNGALTVMPFRPLSNEKASAVKDKAEILWPDLKKIKFEE